ncbi:MAG TPA: TIGR03667 family PPOX class F420-dependent oxidoreductase [Chloroflexia bacterium]|nr:TIGR03667 family PPOX class F420-dependent oxidoreductase [Chloroflexia bacterium]
MDPLLPDPATPFGARVARRLQEEVVIWLTTTGGDGTPQPNPVWFLWDGTSLLIYSLPDAARLAHIARNPRVALHFDGNGQGGDIIVIAGEARISPDDPAADGNPAYCAKYATSIARSFGTPANFAAKYSTALRITPRKVRGF